MQFQLGTDEATELTEAQVLEQCKMYIAAMRIADEFGCDAIGIQYQQGLKDLAPASDLVEGMLNNADRPPVRDAATARELYDGQPLPHFNEVDECSGLDALVTNRVWTALGLDPATTLHDVRWGDDRDGDEFVWVFEISGAVPPAHFVGGYAAPSANASRRCTSASAAAPSRASASRARSSGAASLSMDGTLHADLGRGTVVELPRRRDRAPLAGHHAAVADHARRAPRRHARPDDGRHKANHIQVVYATTARRGQKRAAGQGRDVRRHGRARSTSADGSAELRKTQVDAPERAWSVGPGTGAAVD